MNETVMPESTTSRLLPLKKLAWVRLEAGTRLGLPINIEERIPEPRGLLKEIAPEIADAYNYAIAYLRKYDPRYTTKLGSDGLEILEKLYGYIIEEEERMINNNL